MRWSGARETGAPESSRVRIRSPGKQQPHRHAEVGTQRIVANEIPAIAVWDEVVGLAAARGDAYIPELAVDPDFLDRLGVLADDRDLGLEIGFAVDLGGRRLCALCRSPGRVRRSELNVLAAYHPFADQFFAHPIGETTPEIAADQNDRNLAALSRLHEREHFAQFIERTETTGQDYIGRREAHEHHLAREKIAEVDGDVLIFVSALLEWQQDIETDGR